MAGSTMNLDDAVLATRTGDIWLFRGRSAADRAIQTTTNSPVNHVGMAVVLDDLPPLMWHAELGRSLTDMWTGGHHRGVQLHDLRAAVAQWGTRYGQRAWLRQLHGELSREQEDALLRTVARLDGTPFPSTAKLASRWAAGRLPSLRPRLRLPRRREPPPDGVPRDGEPRAGVPRDEVPQDGVPQDGVPREDERDSALESAYCAEVVAVTYEAMGLLPAGRRASWYDPGRFWSGDHLPLTPGVELGKEIAVEFPAIRPGEEAGASTTDP